MNRIAGRRPRGEWTLDEITIADKRSARRSIAGAAIGNFMEAYDFTLYSLVATILAQTFYPGENSGSGSLIATFGTMTAGFVVRPLGGLIFGPLGGRLGWNTAPGVRIPRMGGGAPPSRRDSCLSGEFVGGRGRRCDDLHRRTRPGPKTRDAGRVSADGHAGR